MLEKVIRLDNIGAFQSGVPRVQTLSKATLIYADNARGKSTLAAVLQACATGDAGPVVSRATIGSQSTPKAQFRFVLPTGGTTVTFDAGKWDSAVPHLQVFDQGFVERNVYAGSEVHPDHHEALLDFALGTAAVAKKQEVDRHAEGQASATRSRTAAEEKLKGYMGQTSLPVFLMLPQLEDVDAQMVETEKRIANAREAAAILARAGLRALELPTFDFEAFSQILGSSFEQIHENARELVSAHLESHGGDVAGRWVNQGQMFHLDDSCPFCGQSAAGLDLIAAYKTYFNVHYGEHMHRVGTLGAKSESALPEASIAAWEAASQANVDRALAWAGQVEIGAKPLDFEEFRKLSQTVRLTLQRAASEKAQAPLSSRDTAVVVEARTAWTSAVDLLNAYNDAIEVANESIATFKKRLEGDSVATLERKLEFQRVRKARHSAEVVKLVDERGAADAERTRLEGAKAAAKKDLDALTDTLLTRYQGSINRWLAHFGAPFTIGQLGVSYQGGGKPRTEYGIVLRGSTVPAGKKSINGPSFHTTLSDGDKRTLALACFLARVMEDHDVAGNIVVFDDVFASMDKHRRSQTMAAITQLAQKCAQVIVLAHDAYFLRDLGRRLRYKKVTDVLELELRRAADNFSELAACDLTELCATDFYKRYRLLSGYLAGNQIDNLLPVAEGLRPLVEGNIHRRFPGYLKEGITFGSILDCVKNAPAGNPLSVLQPNLNALNGFNDFAGSFHHDTSGVARREEVTDGELRVFGAQAMKFIHEGQI